MRSMQRVWRQQQLSLPTKICLFQTCILPILLYGSETLTLLAEDSRRLQSFHISCQRQILRVKWYHHVKNSDIIDTHSLFHSRLKTFLFCKSFPPQPFLFLLRDSLGLHGFPRLFTVISDHICFLLLVFLFLHFLVVGSGR